MVDINRTHLTAVIDRSGSMEPLVTDTIGGFNKFLKDLKETPGEATLTLVLFDDKYEVVYDAKDIKDIPNLDGKVYFARGLTALYDAMGKSILDTGAALAALPEENRPGTVIFLVITDGVENASKEFSGEPGRQRVQEMVSHQTGAYNWSFVFLGANINAKAVGTSLGVSSASSLNYVGDSVGTRAAYEVMSTGTRNRREYTRSAGLVGSTSFVEDPDAIIGATSNSTKIQGTP